MKERGVEHVRYRAVGDFNHVAIQAVLQGMLTEAYRYHCYHKMYSDTTVLMPAPWPTSASPDFRPMEPQQFIEAAHKRSLQVAIFKKDNQVNLREQYKMLLSDFPRTTVHKVGDSQMDTLVGRGRALTQLVSLHSGEVVELDQTRTRWHLRPKSAPCSSSSDWNSPQWHCCENGVPVGTPKVRLDRDEYGRSAVSDMNEDIVDQAKIAANTLDLAPDHFFPAWEDQTNRVLVPCKGADEWQWHRAGPVITLGELFMALGKNYTAAVIYSFYRTCRLVVLKKGKQAQRSCGTPSCASVTGTTGSALQATDIPQINRNKGDLLVDEYGTVNEISTEQLLNEAIQFMNMTLLQGIRPPWLAHDVPQALPGEEVLSNCTRPSFLQWDPALTETLFGEEVYRCLTTITNSVCLTFAGVIGRPFYACMEVVDTATHQLCMNDASMSRYFQQPACRPIYKCPNCIQAAEGMRQEPGSASPSLRVLWMYPLVEGQNGKPTPLRVSSPVRIVVHAPPAYWGWAAKCQRRISGITPVIPDVRGQAEKQYFYDANQSEHIWLWSMPYQAHEPDPASS